MVCTGNICRSPMMERIMRDAVARRAATDQLHVTSAGTWAQPGEPMQLLAASTLTERAIDATGFGATPLTEELVRSAVLVLTATREHRAHVVGLVPASLRKTFTLLELARIAAGAEAPPIEGTRAVDQLGQSVAWAAQMRGSLSRPAEGADDLDDPLGATPEVYLQRADSIASAVEQIVPFLLGRRGPTPAG